MTHKFGGAHTQIKLELVRLYIDFYTRVLKNQPFKLIYIDPFAGSGECEVRSSRLKKDKNTIDVFEDTEHEPSSSNTIMIDGSAKIALGIDRLFNEYHFIENHNSHFTQLESLKKDHPDKEIYLYKGDANETLLGILNKIDWKSSRAIVFMDPYGMETEWDTLVKIAATKAVDMWYLFPLSGVYRQAANDYEKVDNEKAAAIDRMLGTDGWRTAFYDDRQDDLFADEPALKRIADIKDIVRFSRERLGSIFASVPEPRILPDKGPAQFALFFAAANPKAATIALRGANHILKKMSLR